MILLVGLSREKGIRIWKTLFAAGGAVKERPEVAVEDARGRSYRRGQGQELNTPKTPKRSSPPLGVGYRCVGRLA